MTRTLATRKRKTRSLLKRVSRRVRRSPHRFRGDHDEIDMWFETINWQGLTPHSSTPDLPYTLVPDSPESANVLEYILKKFKSKNITSVGLSGTEYTAELQPGKIFKVVFHKKSQIIFTIEGDSWGKDWWPVIPVRIRGFLLER